MKYFVTCIYFQEEVDLVTMVMIPCVSKESHVLLAGSVAMVIYKV